MMDDELTDFEVWQMDISPYSTPASIIARKMKLVAEAATYLLPRVRRVRRQIEKTQKRISAYLDAQGVSDGTP